MIEVNHVSNEFVSPKKYPGLKGAIKGLLSNEKVLQKMGNKMNEGMLSPYAKLCERMDKDSGSQ